MESCIICGSKKSKTIRDTLRYGIKRKVLRCVSCELEKLEPKEKLQRSYYSSKIYRAKHGPNLGKSSSAKEIFETYLPFQGKIIKEFKNILRPDFRVLDIGCSTGHLLASLKGKVKTRVGLELGLAENEFIKKNLDFKIYNQPIEKANISEGPFDLVTIIETLEHVEDPVGFLRSAARQLKPGGYIYVEVPNLSDALLSFYKVKEYADFYYREPHVFYFSDKTFQILMEKAGFFGRVKTVQRYHFFNHMHWLIAHGPQGDFISAMRGRVFSGSESESGKMTEDINRFFDETDKKYKNILTKYHSGDLVTFLGKKRC